jgi:DNA-directed RNA polymerase specialized sigma24 family protein
LRVYGGLSFEQMAATLGEPLPTVASRYRRALEKLSLLMLQGLEDL